MLDKLQASDFSKCLHQKFHIRVEGREPLETELIDVRSHTGSPATRSPATRSDDDPEVRQPFSVLFRGPADLQLTQGTFSLENETLGKLDLFLVTVGPDKEGMLHEAVFT